MTAQIGELTRCLDLVDYKIGVYEDQLGHSTDDHGCGAPLPENDGQS